MNRTRSGAQRATTLATHATRVPGLNQTGFEQHAGPASAAVACYKRWRERTLRARLAA